MSTQLKSAMAAAVAVSVLGFSSVPAEANTTTDFDCQRGSSAFCNGVGYDVWKRVTTTTQYQRDHVCAGAKGQNGDVKAGSACTTYGTNQYQVTLTYSTPASYPYGVWVGDGSTIGIHVHAETPLSSRLAPQSGTDQIVTDAQTSNPPVAVTTSRVVPGPTGETIIGSGRSADGAAYSCYRFPGGSGGCTPATSIRADVPAGAVTSLGNGTYSVLSVLPADTTEAHVEDAGRSVTKLQVANGLASGTLAGPGVDRILVWTAANGVEHRHAIATP